MSSNKLQSSLLIPSPSRVLNMASKNPTPPCRHPELRPKYGVTAPTKEKFEKICGANGQ